MATFSSFRKMPARVYASFMHDSGFMSLARQGHQQKYKQQNDKEMEKTFIRTRSAKDIAIFTSLIILGAVLITLPTGTGINIAGFFMIFAGILIALMMKTGYKDAETGEKYQKKEHYFQQTDKSEVSAALESKPASIDLSQADKGNSVKLDIYYSRKSGKAHLQLFEYVPYKYKPCSQMYEHEMSNIGKLLK